MCNLFTSSCDGQYCLSLSIMTESIIQAIFLHLQSFLFAVLSPLPCVIVWYFPSSLFSLLAGAGGILHLQEQVLTGAFLTCAGMGKPVDCIQLGASRSLPGERASSYPYLGAAASRPNGLLGLAPAI